VIMLAIAAVAFYWIARSFRQEGPGGAAEIGSMMGPRAEALPTAPRA